MNNDVIALLYAFPDADDIGLEAFQASPRYVPPRLARPSRRYRRGERESTEPLDNEGVPTLDSLPCLQLKFSDIPRTDRGLVFGYSPNCDVCLRHESISSYHFSLTFDDEKRLIIKDLGSLMGTQVTYNNEGQGVRRGFQWIVSGHRILHKMTSIIITVLKTISFQIVVMGHDISSSAYITNVNRFCQGAAAAEGLLNDLLLSNAETRRATGAHTPAAGPIELRKELGEGGFGVVIHLWNVSTGGERVVKAPKTASRQLHVDYAAWRREARIMGQISHPHIVRLLDANFTPYPRLYLEYVPLGSLDSHKKISYHETLNIVCQCLSALKYLHEHSPVIAHRDIKPGNILVQYRSKDDIYVKLGDFGLAKDSSELMTICGTSKYLAPEIYLEVARYLGDEERTAYTTAADIWSLGMVACELTCGLPKYEKRYQVEGHTWCKMVIEKLQSHLQMQPNGLGQFLENSMMILLPESRYPAHDCYASAVNLLRSGDRGFQTSPAPYPDESEQLTPTAKNAGADDPSTAIWQPGSHTSGNASRSDVPQSGSVPPASRIILQEGDELRHFFEDYSSDAFNPLFVGSALASALGEKRSWASEFSRVSVNQTPTVPQPSRGPVSAGPSVPRSNEGWRVTGGDDPTIPEVDEEAELAALLLQDINRPY